MKGLYGPLVLFLIGVGLIALSVLRGKADVALFLVFPVIYGSGILSMTGILCIIGAFLLFFFVPFFKAAGSSEGQYQRVERKVESDHKYGGVIFIGPIPIVFGKDKSVTKNMLYIGLVIALILAVVYYFLIFG